jgi:hypothetical protein
MLKLTDLNPLNLNTEKEKFFTSNFTYNPQFVYTKAIDREELTKYGRPKLLHLWLANKIVKKFVSSQTQPTTQPVQDYLTQAEITTILTERLRYYHLEHDYQLVFSPEFVSRISVNNKSQTIKIRLPVTVNRFEIESTMRHEIDTHILRQVNYRQQIWFKQKNRYGLGPHLRTEEGLALINELTSNHSKLAYKSALNYLAVDLALKNDFVSVFHFFYQTWHDADRAWLWTTKKKRGLTDTSQAGGYTKDLVYFEGFLQVLWFLHTHHYDPTALYVGKISHTDLKKIRSLPQANSLLLPKEFRENQAGYQTSLKQIVKENLQAVFS